jgi:DNA-binding NtrC family response regulator
VIERVTLLADGTEIDIDDLPDDLTSSQNRRSFVGQEPVDEMASRATRMLALPLLDARRRIIDAFEREYLDAMLRECAGRVGITATRAGISERALYAKMRQHGLVKERYR